MILSKIILKKIVSISKHVLPVGKRNLSCKGERRFHHFPSPREVQISCHMNERLDALMIELPAFSGFFSHVRRDFQSSYV